MNQREKTLTAIMAGCLLLFGAILILRAWGFKPLRDLDRQTAALRDKLRQINDERRAFLTAEDQLNALARRTLGPNPDLASAHAGQILTTQLLRLGLKESDFIRMPVGPRKLRGAQEIGWTVSGEGALAKIVDLLFVLEQLPQIHRLENLALSAGDHPGFVKVRFRILTLVIDAVSPETPAGPAPAMESQPALDRASAQRRLYEPIVQRDLLRPYLPRQPRSNLPAQANLSIDARPETLKIVSLSQWDGTPGIHILDLAKNQTLQFKPGDALGGGEVALVDYRPLPRPGKPDLISFSRLILKIGTEYWALEPGQTLAEKRLLTPDQLPPQLVHDLNSN